MKSQQAAEREEQQRIKNLVLNYDLNDGEEQDGDSALQPLIPNPNIHNFASGFDKNVTSTFSRSDKSGSNRSGQRSRKLQLSDVDWYDPLQQFSQSQPPGMAPQKSSKVENRLDRVVPKSGARVPMPNATPERKVSRLSKGFEVENKTRGRSTTSEESDLPKEDPPGKLLRIPYIRNG